MSNFEKLHEHVFVTKLAGFEHTKYIQNNETHEKMNEDDIPLVQGKNIRNGFFVNKYDWYICKEISDVLERSKLNKTCILIPYVGSNLGEVGIFYHDYDCHMASNIAKVELIDDYFDIEFLKYYLQSDMGQAFLFQSKQGSAQPNITMEAIRNTLVIDYDINLQQKIAKVLKLIDDKIINNYKIKDELESMAKTIYDYWFLQFDFPDENGKPYKSSGRKMIWNEKLKKEIPEGWKVTKLENLCSFSNGINYEKNKEGDKDYKIVNVRNITSSSLLLDSNNFDEISLPSFQAERYIVNTDDILIARSGTPGATRLLLSSDENIIYCGFIIKCSPNEKNYIYFWHML